MQEETMPKYAIGIDFGTESGRVLLVDVAGGREVATYVHPYANGVIDERLPADAGGVRLEPDWALQDPNDYIEDLQQAVRGPQGERRQPCRCDRVGHRLHGLYDAADEVGRHAALLPAPVRSRPHTWVKLWKHHAAQPEANKLNEIARQRGTRSWIATAARSAPSGLCPRPGRFSMKTRRSTPPLTGSSRHPTGSSGSSPAASRATSRPPATRAIWSKHDGFPPDDFFKALAPGLRTSGR